MNARLETLVVVCLLVVPISASADDPFKSKMFSTLSEASISRQGEGERQAGLSPAGLLVVDYRALACFGIVKDPRENARYSYLMVLKTLPGDRERRAEARFTETSRNLDTDCVLEVMRGETPMWQYKYRRTTDPNTRLTTSESITVGDKEYPLKKPTVFLVDLTVEKPTIELTDIAMPTGAPGLGSDGRIETVIRSLVKLRDESKKVREFLEFKPEP